MIDLKDTMGQALESNQALVSLLGGLRIYQNKSPDAEEFPRITFFEMTNFDSQFANDRVTASEIHFQIDIWSKENNLGQFAVEVDKTMKSIDFTRTSTSPDLYESDTGIYHKALRYRTEVEEG